ncbi:MAG: ABC transporter permease [Planctomycetes bacterium]|nr:ABC transporter permease [Planctomycetota bacterium]
MTSPPPAIAPPLAAPAATAVPRFADADAAAAADATATPAEVLIRPPGRLAHIDLHELWAYRGTLARKIKQRVRLQYDDMWLGFFWAVARPLIMVLVFWAFRRASGAGLGVDIDYRLYVFSGLVLWFYFTDATASVAASLSKDAGLIRKVYFPRLISPLSHLFADSYTLVVAAVPLAMFMYFIGEAPGWHLVLLPLIVAQIMLLALGIGMFFSALMLSGRDWERFLRFALYVGLWVSPVIYSINMIPEAYHGAYHLNPLSGSLLAARAALFEHFPFPWGSWLYACACSAVAAALGLLAFQRAQVSLADRL